MKRNQKYFAFAGNLPNIRLAMNNYSRSKEIMFSEGKIELIITDILENKFNLESQSFINPVVGQNQKFQ